MLAGLAAISLSLLEGWLIVHRATIFSAEDERLYNASVALMGVHALLLSAGLLGLHVLLPKRYRWAWWISAAGALLAVVSGAAFCAAALYESLVQFSYSSWGVLNTLFFVGFFGQPGGAALVGVAALWSRGLGRWRGLPLFAGLVGSPLTQMVLWWLFPPGDMLVPAEDTRTVLAEALRLVSPPALAGLCWFSLGVAAFGIRRRQAVSLTKERRATERTNLDLAHRLYGEAWGAGNVAVLDEAAPNLLDRRHDRRGPGGLKRAILDLRRTFPDLDFSVEEQRADGDTVTTRCRFAGTDRGGLLWYPPTNRRTDFTATYTDRFSNGELAEHDGGTDVDDLLRQLGLTRPAGNDRG